MSDLPSDRPHSVPMPNGFDLPQHEQGPQEPYNQEYPYGRPRWAHARPSVQIKPLNGNAIIGFFLALFGFSLPAIIVSHVALYQLSFTGFERGKALAWVGIVLGYLQVIAWVIFGIWAAIHVAAFLAALSSGFLLPGAVAPTPSSADGGLGELLKELNQLASQG